MRQGLHHYHLRKRKKAGKPEGVLIRGMDKCIYVISILGPIFTLDQVYKIWIQKDAGGVSVLAWTVYFIFGWFWLAYSILHKEKPLILNSVLWIILNGLVALGAFLYS